MEITEKYLVLQQIRYGDKIHYECEMGAETEQCLVPALIIQPIVENAIFHGICCVGGSPADHRLR